MHTHSIEVGRSVGLSFQNKLGWKIDFPSLRLRRSSFALFIGKKREASARLRLRNSDVYVRWPTFVTFYPSSPK